MFGDVDPIGDVCGMLNTPMECSKVPSTSWECLEGLRGLEKEDVLCPRSVGEEVDVEFLLRVDDYLRQIRQQSSAMVEEWNWRKACRSYSIDSDAQIEG